MKYLPMISASFYTPPPPMGAMLAMLDQSPEGRELFALMQKSPYDIIMENFENEKVRLFFVRMVSENLTGPEEKGTGLGIFVFLGFMETYGIGVAVGGSGALTASLIRCIEAHGGKVLNNTSVDTSLDSTLGSRATPNASSFRRIRASPFTALCTNRCDSKPDLTSASPTSPIWCLRI